MSRIVITLHPNTDHLEMVLNDRMFNTERYSFSREKEAVGAEKVLLNVLNNCVVGIVKAETTKNTLKMEIQEGMLLSELIPPTLTAIKEFVGEKGYDPEIFVNDKRYIEQPEYAVSSDEYDHGRQISPGKKAKPGSVDIGVPYMIWTI